MSKNALGNYDRFLDVPEEIRLKAKKFVEIRNAHTGRLMVRGYAETFEPGPFGNTPVLYNAIVDSSDRHEGVVLKERWSFHEEFAMGGQVIWACTEVKP